MPKDARDLHNVSSVRTGSIVASVLFLCLATRVAHAAPGETEAGVAEPIEPRPAVPVAAPPTAAASEQPPVAVPPTAAVVQPTPAEANPLPTGAAPEASKIPHAGDEPADAKHSREKRAKVRPLKVFGYIQVHYRHALATGADPNVDNGDFRVQRARVGVKGDIFPWLGYDVEIDPRAPDITGVLRDAYFSLRFIPRHELRVGQQKTQFGYENRESSTRLYAVNRAEVSDALSRGVTLRDIGLGLVGNVKLGGGFRIEDALTVVNGDGMNVQADRTKMKDVWGRLGARYRRERLGKLDVRLGASGGVGDFIDEGDDPVDTADDFRLEFQRIGADLELDQQWFFVATEYVWGREKNMATKESDDPSGYYVNAVAKTPWQVGPSVRYDAFGDDFKRWTFGLYYGLPGERFRLMLNYEYRKQRDGARADDKLYVWAQASF